MPDTDAVKRELSRLAAGEPLVPLPDDSADSGTDGSREGPSVGRPGSELSPQPTPGSGDEASERYETVVEEGAGAVEALESAAAFRQDGGLARLGRAVESASRAGDREIARRGQRALAAYDRFQRAATGEARVAREVPGADGERADSPRMEGSSLRNSYRGSGRNEGT